MACFEDHLEHAFPQFNGGHFTGPNLSFSSFCFVFLVAEFKGFTVEVVEVWSFVCTEKRPVLAGLHTLHKQIGNPIGSIHVVTPATLITSVFTELEEVLDIVVPAFEVSTSGAAALATLVDGDKLVVVQFKKWNDTLGLTIGSLNVAAGAADCRP